MTLEYPSFSIKMRTTCEMVDADEDDDVTLVVTEEDELDVKDDEEDEEEVEDEEDVGDPDEEREEEELTAVLTDVVLVLLDVREEVEVLVTDGGPVFVAPTLSRR
jgi:hypothetical protein